MKTSFFFRLTLLCCTFVAVSCNHGKDTQQSPGHREPTAVSTEEITQVEVMVLGKSDFINHITSNGKLTALRISDLEFRVRERIASVNVNNGDRVIKGDTIASLETFSLANTLLISRDQYERARLEFFDQLLVSGYATIDTSLIPAHTIRAARIRSGLDKALADLRMAEYNLQHAYLTAPFNGVIANLNGHENEMPASGSSFCTLIDDNRFVACFPVLESEIPLLRNGQTVKIIPFASVSEQFKGTVNSINPVVDKSGMVKIGAVTDNRRGILFEGMNVRVIAGERIPDQLVIPRKAVVLRNDRQVVFIYREGRARWVYISTGLENIDSFTVAEGLSEGDTLIISGNYNLNHNIRVVIK